MGETESIRVAKNGALQDVRTGRFLPGGKVATAFTSETARAAKEREVALRREAAEQGMIEAAQDAGYVAHATADVVRVISKVFTHSAIVNAQDKPRDAVHAARLSLGLAGALPHDEKSVSMAAVQVVIAPALADYVEGIYEDV